MCQEVFKILQTMDMTKVETKLALQCAPVIMGIKISNLLTISQEDEASMRMILEKSELQYYHLIYQKGRMTYLVFRMVDLEAYLQEPDVQSFLQNCGYQGLSPKGILIRFQKRYEDSINKKADFPHEMGVLLGYPIEDVEGFIQNKGEHYLYAGYWKVYECAEEKRLLFDAYESAKEGLVLLVANGYALRSIIQYVQEKGFCSFLDT